MSDTLKMQKTKEELLGYLKEKANNHNYMKIYGSKKKIDNIVNFKTLLLSDGSGWNDTKEAERLNRGDYQYFATCFSFSKSENVAMWMLYTGQENGLMINIQPGVIKKSISQKPKVQIGKLDEDKSFQKLKELSSDKYSIELIDILYCDTEGDTATIKRSDERVDNTDKAILDNLAYCTKSYPWNYENECRLIVKVNKKYLPENAKCILFPIELVSDNQYKIYHSPREMGELTHERSTLGGQINWNLCNNCEFDKKK